MNLRKSLRRYLALPALQSSFRLLYRVALVGMNYGGAGSARSSGDEQALELLRSGSGPFVVFDVGANIGSYVVQVLEHLGEAVTVHAFEPSSAAFARLREHVGDRKTVQLVSKGIGATSGTSTLFSAVPGSVLASTYVSPLDQEALPGEPIEIVSIDDYCRAHGVEHIDLLKLDLEGGELDALRGAQRLLERDAIDMIQFEFGQPSIGARTFFVDLFQLLSARYQIYRVLPHGLVRLDAYHETLEVFMSTNYLAVSRERASRFKLPG
jgi:FkbM family methyltransferase